MQLSDRIVTDAFVTFDDWADDPALIAVLEDCIMTQWKAGKSGFDKYQPSEDADVAVSTEALQDILHGGLDVSDIRTNPELSNCIVFHTTHLAGSLIDASVLERRKLADELIVARIHALFAPMEVDVEVSGHFWYPKGGFMGWHTNLRKPGWRMYVNFAVDEYKSFFRYRHPRTGEIVTSWDKHWNFRMFEIFPERPFWHCVRSETDRFSLGYKITPREDV